MNKNGRGMNLVISLLLIVLLVFWFSGILRSMEDTCTQAEFNQMLDAGEISGAVVVQNREVPTGSVEVHLTSGDEKVLVVSDVNPVLEELETAGVKTIVRDVPGDNIFLTSILPALITVGGVLLIFMMMNAQNAQMNGGNKMMNFGKSRARLSLAGDSKVTLKDVAGLKEEKEDLQEIVDFLRDPGKFTKVGARIPKGVLLEGPPGTGKTLLAKAKQTFRFSRFPVLISWKCSSASVLPASGICSKKQRKMHRVSYSLMKSMRWRGGVEPVWAAVMMKESRR